MKKLLIVLVISLVSASAGLANNNLLNNCQQVCTNCSNQQAYQLCGQYCSSIPQAVQACQASNGGNNNNQANQNYSNLAQQNFACQSCDSCLESDAAINACNQSCTIQASKNKCFMTSLASGASTPEFNQLALKANNDSLIPFLEKIAVLPLMSTNLNVPTQEVIISITKNLWSIANNAVNDLKNRAGNDKRNPPAKLIYKYGTELDSLMQGYGQLLNNQGPTKQDTPDSLGEYMKNVALATKDIWDAIIMTFGDVALRDITIKMVTGSQTTNSF